ncbi:mechanosensitive ion channel [Microbacterium sediminicola]|uniref:Mechanosensitive ion channel n=1 Tax=Microbacterium sediminicola TaxID=415210 RepID=A0ABN2I7S3_9MICO
MTETFWGPWLAFGIAVVVAVIGAFLFTFIVAGIVKLALRKRPWGKMFVRYARRPFRAFVLIIALWIAIDGFLPLGAAGGDDASHTMWDTIIDRTGGIAAIAAATWLLIELVRFGTELALGHYRIDVPDNRIARKIRTQVLILRRVAIVIIVIIGFGAALLTFPAVQTFGTSVLASAGIASIVAGLAAQSVLANMFAGVQLVFSEALRVDDVIVAEGEWGRVGEITLSYVVLDLWDDRRLVLPCTYFTTTPFQNWTRSGSELLGAVELDLDWRVSTARMREHLKEVVAATELWDGRTVVLQVTEATGGYVRVRILATAKDAPTLFDLRCHIREEMVAWVRRTNPDALPVQRVLLTDGAGDASGDHVRHEDPTPTGQTEGLFSGSADAEARAAQYTSAIPVVTDGEASDRDPR